MPYDKRQAARDELKNSSLGVVLVLALALISCLMLHSLGHGEPVINSGKTGMIFLAGFALYRFALAAFPSFKPGPTEGLTLLLILVATMVFVWFGFFFAASIAAYEGARAVLGPLHADTLYFAIPFASGALVLQAVLGMHYALVYGLLLALVLGVHFPYEALLDLYALVTSLVACLSLSRCRARSAYLKAGLNTSVFAILFALCAALISPHLSLAEFGVLVLCALVNGILCSVIASGLTPVVESFGGYVTDMRLIEMATLDHPLLKELSVQAPGTWNHSMVMGMMGEAAAEAIGANPVLTRVGAYYHDVGKIKKPLYFVENQGEGKNRHDRLTPSMSALIIRSHVKDGLEFAEKHGLPRAIQDMIPQHHGTNLIEYFYDKAVREARETDENAEVDQTPFLYGGPKPQTREAGILMLADGIEAAARSLEEPDADRLQALIQKLINKIFAAGQLDESQLTLRDLHLIAKAFSRVLGGIYHRRIAYAETNSHEDHEKEEERPVFEIDPLQVSSAAGAPGAGISQAVDTSRSKDSEVGDHGLHKKNQPHPEGTDSTETHSENLKRLGL